MSCHLKHLFYLVQYSFTQKCHMTIAIHVDFKESHIMQVENTIQHSSKLSSILVKSDNINNGNIQYMKYRRKLKSSQALSITNQNVSCSFKGLSFLTHIFRFIYDHTLRLLNNICIVALLHFSLPSGRGI